MEFKKNDQISKLKVIIVSHTYTTGAPQKLREFLIEKVEKLVFIGHPFYYCEDIRSSIEIYSGGELKSHKFFFKLFRSEPLLYIKDFILTPWWALKSKTRFDMYVGVDPLNALVGLLLRKIKIVKKVIFYTIDYSPVRFENKILNSIYDRMEKICVYNSDIVWNLSSDMAN